MASARWRSSLVSDETSAAWPLATIPVTPLVSASQERCRRYAGSSIARSAVKGRMLAGMTPEKRSGSVMASSPRGDGIDGLLGGYDSHVGPANDVEGRLLDRGPEGGHTVLDHGHAIFAVEGPDHGGEHADVGHGADDHQGGDAAGAERAVERRAREGVVPVLADDQ